jgi:hypothetical protein
MLTTIRHAFVTALSAGLLTSGLAAATPALAATAYLEITNKVERADRPAAVAIYKKYRQPFLTQVPGAKSMLIRQNDVRVLHGFATAKQAEAYLSSDLFTKDVVVALKPLLKADPAVRIYSTP